VERAFSTSLLSGRYDGRAVTFPGSLPSLPAGLESEVAGVSGLSTGFNRFSLPLIPAPMVTAGRPGPAQNPANLVTPSIARGIYGVSGLYNLTASPTYATGKGIVLLLWGAGYAPSDISTFFAQNYPATFPAPHVAAFPVDGAPPPAASAVNDPSNGSREMTLDIEWSGSMAPGATLDAVYAPAGPAANGYSPSDTSMIDALNLAVDPSHIPGVATISMSFGSADGADPTLTTGFENDFSIAAHEGITLFAATGDLGGDAAAGCTGGVQPDYPSSSPQVVAVGGTSVSLNYGALGGITGFSEAAWGMSGGGFSVQFPAPSWQEVGSAAAPISANGHRGMPDVAATAGYNYLYFNGGPAAGGGTSFATPLWAGMVTEMDALRGANFGFLTPALYDLGSNSSLAHPAFNDITSGRNCLGAAGPGWDTATGWGTPVAVNLFEHLVASFVNISVVATPSPVTPGGMVTVVVSATNATSGRPIAAGIPVTVTLASTGLVGPCAGTFGSATPLSNRTGNVVAAISVPVCFLGSNAIATAMIASGGYYGTNSTTVSVNLLGVLPALKPLTQFPNNILLFVLIIGVGTTVGGLLGRRREVTPIVPPVPVAPPPAGAPVLSPPPDPSSRTGPLHR
jgi:kumamolisin